LYVNVNYDKRGADVKLKMDVGDKKQQHFTIPKPTDIRTFSFSGIKTINKKPDQIK